MTKSDLRLWEAADEEAKTFVYVAAFDKVNATTLAKRFFSHNEPVKMISGVPLEEAGKIEANGGTLLDLFNSQQKHGIAAVLHKHEVR